MACERLLEFETNEVIRTIDQSRPGAISGVGPFPRDQYQHHSAAGNRCVDRFNKVLARLDIVHIHEQSSGWECGRETVEESSCVTLSVSSSIADEQAARSRLGRAAASTAARSTLRTGGGTEPFINPRPRSPHASWGPGAVSAMPHVHFPEPRIGISVGLEPCDAFQPDQLRRQLELFPREPENGNQTRLGTVRSIEAIEFKCARAAREPELGYQEDGVVALEDGVLNVGLKRLVRRQRLVLPHVDPDRPEPAGQIPRERRVRGVS